MLNQVIKVVVNRFFCQSSVVSNSRGQLLLIKDDLIKFCNICWDNCYKTRYLGQRQFRLFVKRYTENGQALLVKLF